MHKRPQIIVMRLLRPLSRGRQGYKSTLCRWLKPFTKAPRLSRSLECLSFLHRSCKCLTLLPCSALQPRQSKLQSLKTRAISTVVLIGSFVAINYLGHVPLMAMIFGIQVCAAPAAAAFRLVHAAALLPDQRLMRLLCDSFSWSGSCSSSLAKLSASDRTRGQEMTSGP